MGELMNCKYAVKSVGTKCPTLASKPFILLIIIELYSQYEISSCGCYRCDI